MFSCVPDVVDAKSVERFAAVPVGVNGVDARSAGCMLVDGEWTWSRELVDSNCAATRGGGLAECLGIFAAGPLVPSFV